MVQGNSFQVARRMAQSEQQINPVLAAKDIPLNKLQVVPRQGVPGHRFGRELYG